MTDQQIQDFAEAITRGDLLYTNLETIDELRQHSEELADRFTPSPFVDPGNLYAIQRLPNFLSGN